MNEVRCVHQTTQATLHMYIASYTNKGDLLEEIIIAELS